MQIPGVNYDAVSVTSRSSVRVFRKQATRNQLPFASASSVFSHILIVVAIAAMTLASAGAPGFHANIEPVDLPKATQPLPMPGATRDGAMVVIILRDSRVFFCKEQVTEPELLLKIRERLSEGAENRIYLKADTRVRYKTVSEVLHTIQSSGVERVAVLTKRSRSQSAAIK